MRIWSLLMALLVFGGFSSVTAGEGDKPHPGLYKPELAAEKAPDTFKVKFSTTKGDFEVLVTREWAPKGVDRFYNLVKIGYFKDIAFYRVIHGFMAQFGFSGEPKLNDLWSNRSIQDDPVKQSNTTGRLTFANRGRNTRATQFFINEANNANLDAMGFAPFGEVLGEGLNVIKSLYGGYGEGYPRGRGPNQMEIKNKGNDYLKEQFPKLDYIKSVSLVK